MRLIMAVELPVTTSTPSAGSSEAAVSTSTPVACSFTVLYSTMLSLPSPPPDEPPEQPVSSSAEATATAPAALMPFRFMIHYLSMGVVGLCGEGSVRVQDRPSSSSTSRCSSAEPDATQAVGVSIVMGRPRSSLIAPPAPSTMGTRAQTS